MLIPVKSRNGTQPANELDPFDEIGTSGIESWSGYIQAAYNTKLYWPVAYEIYNRLWRADPECVVVRNSFSAWAGSQSMPWELPPDPTPADQRINEFLNQVIDDIEGGERLFLQTMTGRVPFFGWGLWEMVPGLRRKNWTPPDDSDPWRSKYNDGLVGLRRLAFRDHSSFERWEMDDTTGRVGGMWQNDSPSPRILIPSSRAVHLRFGDPTNPEGMTPLEALWRLERHYYALQFIQGVGFEHSAGHLKITAYETPDAAAQAIIRRSARAVLAAQDGNYFTQIDGKFSGEIMDVPFAAAGDILEAIKYYSTLKLQLFGMQWIALSATSGTGSFAAMQDSSVMALLAFNNMQKDFAAQAGAQMWRTLAELNPALFSQASAEQRLTITPVEKSVGLDELAGFVQSVFPLLTTGDDDIIAVRRKSGFLPEAIPEEEEAAEMPESEDAPVQDTDAPENIESTQGLNGAQITAAIAVLEKLTAKTMTGGVAVELLVSVGIQRDRAETMVADMLANADPVEPGQLAEFAAAEKHKHTGPGPIDITKDDDDPPLDDPEDIQRLIKDVERFAKRKGLDLDQLLNAEPIEEEEPPAGLAMTAPDETLIERITGRFTELVASIRPTPVHIHAPDQNITVEAAEMPAQQAPVVNVNVPEQQPPIVNNQVDVKLAGRVSERMTVERDPLTDLITGSTTETEYSEDG